MLKNILNLEGVTVLSKKQQSVISGGNIEITDSSSSLVCKDNRYVQFTWSCPDGSASGSGHTCPEFLQAYADMIDDFCA